MIRLTLLTLLSLISFSGTAASPGSSISLERLDSIMAVTPLTAIEGVWQFLPDNASIAVIRQPGQASNPVVFDVYLYSTISARIQPGLLIGSLSATPAKDEFLLTLAVNPDNKPWRKHKKFVTRLTDPAHLSFAPLKSGISVNLFRLVPYLFRVSITSQKGNAPEGCIKLKPLAPGVSEPVIYL